jgi:hypothetical protein
MLILSDIIGFRMSDGPYKSLPMSRAWKRLAEFAQNDNFEPGHIAEAALNALMRDWRANVPAALPAAVREVFCGSQSTLFNEQRVEQLRIIGEQTGNRAFGRLFLDCAVLQMESGQTGETGFVQATVDALLARAARGIRQVEEHYFRKASAPLAKSVGSRLEQGVISADLAGCARTLLKISPAPARRPSLRHQGIDEGVPIERRK